MALARRFRRIWHDEIHRVRRFCNTKNECNMKRKKSLRFKSTHVPRKNRTTKFVKKARCFCNLINKCVNGSFFRKLSGHYQEQDNVLRNEKDNTISIYILYST